jgi:hypothetical protein
MRTLATCLGIGMLLLSACGSSSKDKGGAGGKGGGTTLAPQGNCAALTCLDGLSSAMSSCAPSGTCTMSVSASAIGICYANGVKLGITGASATSMTGTVTVKNGSKVCYIMEATETAYVIKDASGATIATMGAGADVSGGTPITCADGTTGTLDSTCGSGAEEVSTTISSATNSALGCAQGDCTF